MSIISDLVGRCYVGGNANPSLVPNALDSQNVVASPATFGPLAPQPEETPTTTSGPSLPLLVGRCYAIGAPAIPNAPNALDSTGPAVAPPATTGPLAPAADPNTGPTPAPSLPEVIGRCYAQAPVPLLPNVLDSLSPRGDADTGDGDPPDTPANTIGDAIRGLVNRCYPGLQDPNDPDNTNPQNPLDQDNPKPRIELPDPSPDPTPPEIIQGLVNRCYPDQGPPQLVLEPPPSDIDLPGFDIISIPGDTIKEYLDILIPDLPDGGWNWEFKPPNFGSGTTPWDGEGGDRYDCDKVIKLYKKNKKNIKEIRDGTYKDLETGEIYYCPDYPDNPNTKFENCVKDALECMFRPYMGGDFYPDRPNCKEYIYKGWYANKDEVCVGNCFAERQGVYEAQQTGGGPRNIELTPRGNNGIHAIPNVTTDSSGNFLGNDAVAFNPGGNQIFNSGSTQTYNYSYSWGSMQVKVNPIDDGGEWDSKWWVQSWSGNLPSIGTTWTETENFGQASHTMEFEIVADGDHLYTLLPNQIPAGYELTSEEPVFYTLKENVKHTVPLLRYYSASQTDTLLTTNFGTRGEYPITYSSGQSPSAGRRVVDGGKKIEYDDNWLGGSNPGWDTNASLEILDSSTADAIFTNDGNKLVANSTGTLDLKFKWDDNPNQSGLAVDYLEIKGQRWEQSGEEGSVTHSISVSVFEGGEYPYLSANDYEFIENLGYVFLDPSRSVNHCAEYELIYPLDRYYNANLTDHRYTISIENYKNLPQTLNKRFAYKIGKNPKNSIRIEFDVEHGDAGYDNAVGVYLANSNGPQWGRIIQPGTKGGDRVASVTINKKNLKEYKGGTFGFFLAPNGGGLNSLSVGQEVTFSSQSDGYRADGISTAEGNYCMFSDSDWNPNDKDYTKWEGIGRQFWEDLLNGDDDYDDVRMWHRLRWWKNRENYRGTQCFVFGDPNPPKIMQKILPETCDERVLIHAFHDVALIREDCGTLAIEIDNKEIDYPCANCSGGYSVEHYRSQTIEMSIGGRVRFVSMGGITGGLTGDCMKYTLRVSKNGNQVWQKQFTARKWPNIHEKLKKSGGDINLSSGDSLTFEVVSIDHGYPASSIAPALALYDIDNKRILSSFKLQLGTVNTDDLLGMAEGNTNNKLTKEKIAEDPTRSFGEVTAMAMQFSPVNQGDDEWRPGSLEDESWYLYDEDAFGSDYPATLVWKDNSRVNMHGTNQGSPDVIGGTRNYNDDYNGNDYLMPNISGGYIDTGYVEDDYRDSRKKAQKESGVYNEMLEDFLICKGKFDKQVNDSTEKGLTRVTPHMFAKDWLPWYLAGTTDGDGGGLYNNRYNAADSFYDGSSGYTSPHTFTHDYYLAPDDGENLGNVDNLCKVRVGFTFYNPSNEDTRSKYSYYWQCVIHIVDVLERGKGYQKGQSFDFYWPPVRDKRTERSGQSPYYPSVPSGRMETYDEDGGERVARYAFYQESHERDSMEWYYCDKDKKYRVRFRITVWETDGDNETGDGYGAAD